MYNAVDLVIEVDENGIINLSLGDYKGLSNAPVAVENNKIRTYIDMFNKSKVQLDSQFPYRKSCKCDVYLCFYNEKYLEGVLHGACFIEDFGTEFHSFSEYDTAKPARIIYEKPTIHLTEGNIFASKESNSKEDVEPNKRYARFMDSSIWNYYVPILVVDKNKIGEPSCYDFSPLKFALLEILNNNFYTIQEKENNLYKLSVAREYANLFSRIVNQSFLPTITGGHDENVSPYLFHSEQKLKTEIEEKKRESENENKKNIVKTILSYKWRILLIDDHATRGLTIGKKEESDLTKLKIVQEELSDLFGKEAITTDCKNQKAKIYIDCASTIKEAQNKLKEKKYEIILLDYLLGEKGAGREYGYELLKGIWYKENEKNFEKDRKDELEKLYKEFVFDYKKGPDDRFYFMFISAFTTAVSERLLTQGWARNEDYWYIGEGACPINTPYLFQYRLLHIMEKRMKKMGIFILSKTANDDFKASKIYEDVIAKIFPEDKDKNKGGNIRKYANDKFQDVLSLLYHYKNLLVDTQITTTIFDTKESVLATDFVMKNPNIGGLLEHLTQLVYLTAFGTVRQWPEMWEEYQFIKSIIGQPIGAIEEYIVNLKNNDL